MNYDNSVSLISFTSTVVISTYFVILLIMTTRMYSVQSINSVNGLK